MAQSIDGDVTTFAWDWASALPEILRDGSNLYLVGHDTLGRWDGDEWAYHLPDALGSVRHLADSTGQVVGSYSFDPFGVPLEESGGEPYGFTGEQWDASAGLVFLRARYMQPATGRFLSKDPLPGYAHSPQSLNRWIYVRNNPVGLVDPSGLQEPGPVPTPEPVALEGTPTPRLQPSPPRQTPTPPTGVPTPPAGTPTPTVSPESANYLKWT